MFGGLTFMVAGRMCVGVDGRDLLLRLGPEDAARALDEPHVRPMDFTGRPVRGFVFVSPPAFRSRALLARWIERAVVYAEATSPAEKRARGGTASGSAASRRRRAPARGDSSG